MGKGATGCFRKCGFSFVYHIIMGGDFTITLAVMFSRLNSSELHVVSMDLQFRGMWGKFARKIMGRDVCGVFIEWCFFQPGC